jgi:hypothetical protein
MDQVEVIEAVNAVKSKEVNHHYKWNEKGDGVDD